MKDRKKYIIFGIIFLSAIFICFTEFNLKKGYHEDEVYKIISSNNDIWNQGLLNFSGGGVVWKEKDELEKEVYSDGNFSFQQIYENQVKDVHPPFYYLLVALMNKMFPQNLWRNAFLINLLFFFLIQFIIIKILTLIEKKEIIIPVLILLNFSTYTINMVLFERMYTVLTFFGLVYLYFNLKLRKEEFQITKEIALGLSLGAILGFLTQYFFLIYAIGIYAWNTFELIKKKEKKKCFIYFLIHLVSGLLAIILYPVSIEHILFGNRGIGTLVNTSFFTKLYMFGTLFKKNINISSWWILLFFILYLAKSRKNYKNVLIYPVLIYFICASYLSPFVDIRYIMIIMPIVIIVLVIVLQKEFKNKATIIFLIFITISGFFKNEPMYLYQEYETREKASIENQNYPYIYVTDNNFTFLKDIPSMLNYQKIALFNINSVSLEEFPKLNTYILYIEEWINKDTIFENINLKNKKITELENNLYKVENTDI